jgi:NAD(P)-dependent dehydrogenase (short-subunit alcohol dehydrogenase family)
MRDLSGKVAVVTGAASGIGLGIATRFADEGMKVVLADIETPALEAAVAALRQSKHDVLGIQTDVSSFDSVQELAARAYEAYGDVHVLCNNAGVGGGTLVWQASERDWQWILGVNLWGVINGIRAFVPRMLAAGDEGHVVNTASAAGVVSPSMDALYAASKHAVVAISEALYFQLHIVQSKLSASVLCPGFVRTSILDSSRNRPPGLRDEVDNLDISRVSPEGAAFMRGLIEGGLSPSDVAGMVVDAVREDRFWILTGDEFSPAVRDRMESILERRNPRLAPLG